MDRGRIRVGIGGWVHKAWRGPFYPKGLAQKDELAHAARRLGAIEINGTFYRSQSPETFEKWGAAVPEGFEFSVKAQRWPVTRPDLRDAGEGIDWFLGGGVAELGAALGPILWQLPERKAFDADEFGTFLSLLPDTAGGRRLRHAVEVRHESFRCAEAVALMAERRVAVVRALDTDWPDLPDITADFAYVRFMGTAPDHPKGYAEDALDARAELLRDLSAGVIRGAPVGAATGPAPTDVYAFVIGGEKDVNPLAAMALAGRIAGD